MIKMASFFNPLAVYCQSQGQPSSHQQLSQQAQQHIPQAHYIQQQAVTSATAPSGSSVEIDQPCWYAYPHHHHHLHHQSGPQQHHSDVIMLPSHPHAHPYSHIHYQHHSVTYQHHSQHNPSSQIGTAAATATTTTTPGTNEWSEDEGNNIAVETSEPSPPITASCSETSSPGTPLSPSRNNNNNNNINGMNNNSGNNNIPTTTPLRPAQLRSPYEWLKKTSYQNQPNPGKTRTKDKYRVVYTDHQRVELEKEFHYSKYINIKRKAELAANLALSERQVKIWFQNRRAKNRKQMKKRLELEQKEIKPDPDSLTGGISSLSGLSGLSYVNSDGSPPLSLNTPPHTMPFSHQSSSIHSHPYQHTHPHKLLGL